MLEGFDLDCRRGGSGGRSRFVLAALTLVWTGTVGVPHLSAQEAVPDGPLVVSLAEAVAMALQHSPAARQAEAEVELASNEAMELRGSWFPSLSLNSAFANSSNQRFDQATGQLVSQNYSAQLQGGVDLFTGGRRLVQGRAVGARLSAVREGARNQRFQTALFTTELYFRAAAADELVRSATQRLDRAREQLRFAESRLEVGTATRSDLLRAELEVGNAELSLVEAESALRSSRLQLGRQVGFQREVRPAEDVLPLLPPPLPELEELTTLAELRSPLAQAARSAVRDREAMRLSSWTAYAPTLRLTGGYDWFAFDFPPDQRSWTLRVFASLPLFNGFQREAAISRARIQEDLARVRERDALIGVRVAVEDAYLEIGSAGRRVTIAERGVELASEDLRVQEERYQIGAATILELQTSQVAVTEAEGAWVRERQGLGVAVARLEAVLGESLSGELR